MLAEETLEEIIRLKAEKHTCQQIINQLDLPFGVRQLQRYIKEERGDRDSAFHRSSAWIDRVQVLVRQGMTCKQLITVLRIEYNETISEKTLRRVLNRHEIFKTERISQDLVQELVSKEICGPGKRLGYRLMHNHLKNAYNINLPRDQVMIAQKVVDPEGVELRSRKGTCIFY
jgi:hypothetical protein